MLRNKIKNVGEKVKMKISIITATFQSAKTVKDTLESVLGQTYTNLEHIIVDGASKDNTMEIVKSYEGAYQGRLKYISEKDTDLYDAMNKGIKMATGDIIGILNSDDKYAHKNVLQEIANCFEKTNCDGTYGNLIFMDAETMSKPQRIWRSKEGKLEEGWIPAHPTLYLKREVYDKIGLFNLSYRIVADYDFMVRMLKDKTIHLSYIDDDLVHMRVGGVSTDGIKGYYKNLKEAHKVLVANQIPHPYYIDFRRCVKTVGQMLKKSDAKTENHSAETSFLEDTAKQESIS